ncbi:MAG: hypothetical protein H7146_00715 [Burkholderiaceae bacterium]|nr:hypothetical protein [Microbacteriaceae bacterium]
MHLSREHLIRALWTLFEPVHAVSYFAPQARAAFADIGLPRYWDGYFAGRAAPLGRIGGAPVTAIFSGFAPALVERALPAVWATVTPAQALEARSVGAAASLRALAADAGVIEASVALAADALAPIALGITTIGRPLAAANRTLAAEPDPANPDPFRRLWQAATTLREHRGDGHVIALVAGDIAGLTTIVLRASLDLDAAAVQQSRGWTAEEWDAEVCSLVRRGLLESPGGGGAEKPASRISPAGRTALDAAERLTNILAVGPWADLDDDRLREIARTLEPIALACGAAFPYPNPIGMPRPWDATADPEATTVPGGPRSE